MTSRSDPNKNAPPRLARNILLRFLRRDLEEEVVGDLDEKFQRMTRKASPFRAKVNYWYQVFHYMRPFAIRRKQLLATNQYDMFRNYFSVGLRTLVKSKFFSLINIGGMAISMAIFFVISLYVYDEMSFDRHIADAHLKFRVFNEHFNDDGSRKKGAMVPPMIAPTLAAEYPQVEYYARFLNFNSPVLFEVGEKKFTEENGGAADPGLFDMLSIRLLEGDRNTALREPNTVAISKTLRQKYFGEGPAVGRSIEITDTNFEVVAVFEDFPDNAHFQRDYLIALEGTIAPHRMQSWGWNQFHTYVKLKPGSDEATLEGLLPAFAEKHAWPETKPNGGYYIPHLMPIRKIHLQAYDQAWDIAVSGNIYTVYILAGIAVFILVIAVLNFVNLSTARAINRFKEVGVRKAMGAFRIQIIHQFVSESILIAFLALAIAALLASVVLPYVNTFAEKSIPPDVFLNARWMGALLAFGLVTGVLAGVYPAFFISSAQPVRILSGKDAGVLDKGVLRKALVVFQFMLSFFLIIASFVVSDQHTFMRTTDMGFDKDNLVILRMRGDMAQNLETTKRAFSSHPNVMHATIGYGLPGQAYAGDGIIDRETGKRWHINMLAVDHDYVKTLGLEVIAGRDFSRDVPSDAHGAFILSETAAHMLGHRDAADAIGHEVAWERWNAPDSLKEGTVIGIIRDVQLNSMRESMAPIALQLYPDAYVTLTLRIRGEGTPETIAHLDKTWKTFNSEWPFEYKFLDDNFDRMYKSEERLAVLFRIFTAFTVLVACLGLFGLVVYSTTQRYREISIRKVLGANETSLIVLLARTYALLIGLAFVIAAPVSYYAARKWLETFAFRIDLSPLLFLRAGLVILLIALITVGVQAFKAARTNPVDALKEQ